MPLEFQGDMKKTLLLLFSISLLFLFLHGLAESKHTIDENTTKQLIEYTPWYVTLTDSAGLSKAALYSAYQRFSELVLSDSSINDSLLTILDFSKPSNEERLYLIDIKNQQLLIKSLVAHGQNSGSLYAESFSNRPKSHMSSLGMYVTAYTYSGKHGYSLRLNGIDRGMNDKAFERAIVVHGANYVSKKYITEVGRIGRSFGCPALPPHKSDAIINFIKEGSCLYIYHPLALI